MKAPLFYLVLCISSTLILSCKDNIDLQPESKTEYIIKMYYDNDSADPDWFRVVDIHTNRFQAVPAVLELEGTYYLPIKSSLPSYGCKVVAGEFFIDKPLGSPKPDTVFKVTNHLRDTLVIN